MKKILIASLAVLTLSSVSLAYAGSGIDIEQQKYDCRTEGWTIRGKSNGGSVQVKVGSEEILNTSIEAGAFEVKFLMPKGKGQASASFKITSGASSNEIEIRWHPDHCKESGNGGAIHPCILEGTCPCIGFTYWELAKGYCSAEHMILPEKYVREQKMIRLASLLEQVVGLYQKLLANLR